MLIIEQADSSKVNWRFELTEEEYRAWEEYEKHTHLLKMVPPLSYESVLDMFLCNFRYIKSKNN